MVKAAKLTHARNTNKGSRAVSIGLGDYSRRDSDISAFFAQRLFIEHIDTEAPQVRHSLRGLLGFSQGEELDAEIDNWATKYRLLSRNGKPPRWIRQTARGTLRFWTQLPNAVGWYHPPALDWGLLAERDCRILIDTSWDPSGSESQDAAVERIAADVGQQINGIVLRAESAGGTKTLQKRRPEHFGWLVRYIVNQEQAESIAKSGKPYSAAVTSIKQALRETAALLPLTLPSFEAMGKPGRPRKIAKLSRRNS